MMSSEIVAEPSVRRSVRVRANVERAFRVYTAELDSWWPKTHHIGSSPMTRAVMEGHVGGRCYSEQADAPPPAQPKAADQKTAEAKPKPAPKPHVVQQPKPQPAAQTASVQGAAPTAPAAQAPGSQPAPWPGQQQQAQPQAGWPAPSPGK